MVCATSKKEDAQKVLRSLEGMRRYGYDLPDDVLGEDEIHELEPSLNDRVKAGFHLAEQWNVKADTLVDGLATRLREMGVEFLEGAEVIEFDRTDTVVRSVRTGAGDVGGDHFVLAAGSWTTPLAARLGVKIPMEPGKGYSFLLTPKQMPKHGILFADIHAGVTPLGDRVRIGGTMEFSGYDLTIDERRISNLFELARGYIDLEKPDYEEPWAGLRPMTVDGLPILDWAQPYRNAYLATGYSMLGMTDLAARERSDGGDDRHRIATRRLRALPCRPLPACHRASPRQLTTRAEPGAQAPGGPRMRPPSIVSTVPVTHSASGSARCPIQRAISSGWPTRPSGTSFSSSRSLASGSATAVWNSVATGPGRTQTTRTRSGASSAAMFIVMCSRAAFVRP